MNDRRPFRVNLELIFCFFCFSLASKARAGGGGGEGWVEVWCDAQIAIDGRTKRDSTSTGMHGI